MFSIAKAATPQATPILQSLICLVTPEMARRLRDTAHFDRQRNIAPANVDRLADEIRAGRFTAGTQIYICVLPDGRELIVNGNHTLEAVAHCGVSQVLTITRKAVADENEAGRIYAVFDIQKLRSWRDSLRATGIAADLLNADRALAAIGVMDSNFGQSWRHAVSRIERINRLEEYRTAMEFWNAAVASCPKANVMLIRRASVLAVALETLRYQPTLAFEFWGKVAKDDGLTTGMPEKALLSWLRNTRASGGTAQAEHCRAAALAWNAAFRGNSRQSIRPNLMHEFYLLGTPIANGLGV